MLTSKYKKILVAVDGSENADKAFEEAMDTAKRNDSILEIVFVINVINMETTSFAYSRALPNFLEDERKLGDDELNKKMELAKSEGIKDVKVFSDIAEPKHRIVEFAEEEKVDLVIMGATGKGAIQRAFIGSTTSYVVNHAPCNVLVVK